MAQKRAQATKLAYRTLIQTPEGAMSGDAGDYLETIYVGEKSYQRIVPAWVYEAGCRGKKGRVAALPAEVEKAVDRIEQRLNAAFSPDEMGMIIPAMSRPYDEGEPHDGYSLIRD